MSIIAKLAKNLILFIMLSAITFSFLFLLRDIPAPTQKITKEIEYAKITD